MEAFLDGEPRAYSLAESERLDTLLAEINRDMAEQGRAVVSIHCNGQEVDADELVAALARPLSGFQRVELTSMPAGEVAQAVLAQAAALVQETEQDHSGIVELLNEGNTVRGMELLGGSFRVWQQAHEAVLQAVRLAHIPLDQIQVQGAPSAEIIQGLKGKLEQVKEALEARDYVMLADILQYEMGETVQSWKALIDQLSAQLSNQA